jgi:hypothetical protein
MQDWLAEEAKLLQAEQEAFGIEGRVPFWKVPIGVTKIEIDTSHAPFVGKFEGKKVFHIFVDGNLKLWSISIKSPLYRDLIRALIAEKKLFNLIRIGDTMSDTRYQLVPL